MATELENLVPEADVEVEGMRGPKGEKGDSYVLTEADKEEIASKVDTIIDAETDKSLTISGKPADAKAAGDEINNLKADLSEMNTATSSDVGKALKAKSVSGGKVTEWEFGEAGGIAENITPEQTTFIETVESENLFDKATVTRGKYFKTSDGTEGVSGNLSCQYIPFKGAGTYVCYYPTDAFGWQYAKTCLFDSNKTFIKSVPCTMLVSQTNVRQPASFTVSAEDASTVAYMGYSLSTDDIDTAMFVKASAYPSEYIPYFETEYYLDPDIKLTVPVDASLTEQGVSADAKATGDAITRSVEGLNGIRASLSASTFGKMEVKQVSYSEAVAEISNNDISNSVSNAVLAEIVSVSGNEDGSVPTAFISQSENLMNPEIVCAGAENRGAGYQIDINEKSKCAISDNKDGTFTCIITPASSFMLISDKLISAETYNIYVELATSVTLGVTFYLLDEQYVVTRKLGYAGGAFRIKYRVKLASNEKYFAFTATKSGAAILTLKYPEVWISDIKESTTDVVSDNSYTNQYTYVPYRTTKLELDTDAIRELFPGFGQANGNTSNILYLKDKRALQYGYYSDDAWVTDAKSIDLSAVIGDAIIQVVPKGTLTILHTEETVPSWVVEYNLDREMPYAGTFWTGYGDSLTAGPDRNGYFGAYRRYAKSLLDLYRYYDCGVPMSQLSGNGTYSPMWTDTRIETIPLDSDVITIMGGSNDTGQAIAEETPYGGMTGWGEAVLTNHDITTFIGAYNVIISKILYKFMLSDGYYSDVDYTGLTRVATAKPWFRLVLITPPPQFDTADRREALVKIAECVRTVGNLWGLPVVDAHDNLGVNDINKDTYFTDDEGYVHMNIIAHARLANLIVAKAKEITELT